MAKLVDAPGLGPDARNGVGVRVPLPPLHRILRSRRPRLVHDPLEPRIRADRVEAFQNETAPQRRASRPRPLEDVQGELPIAEGDGRERDGPRIPQVEDGREAAPLPGSSKRTQRLAEQCVGRRAVARTRLHLGHVDHDLPEWKAGIDHVLGGIEAGWLKVPIEGVFPLAEAAEMHRRLEGRHVAGKLLLKA